MFDLQAIRADLQTIAARAGEAVMPFFNQPHQETIKSNLYDVVTEGDKASEAVIVPALQAAYPEWGIISEEGAAAGENPDAQYFWHIDPIDGTTNFATNLPLFAISIALADRALQPLVGVVYNPVYREMFSAARGFGATLNGAPIHVTTTDALNRAVLSTGFSYQRHTVADNNLAAWETMLMQARDLRRLGSAATDLAWVAAGRLDGYWERYLHSWDLMAGILLVREAGGRVSDYSGETEQLVASEALVATNGQLHEAVLEILNNPR